MWQRVTLTWPTVLTVMSVSLTPVLGLSSSLPCELPRSLEFLSSLSTGVRNFDLNTVSVIYPSRYHFVVLLALRDLSEGLALSACAERILRGELCGE